jgi:hypothetical protein
MNLLEFSMDIQRLYYENVELKKENQRLLGIEKEYNELLRTSNEHNQKMFSNVLKLCLNGIDSFKQEEWQPDWSKIKYDYLAMDNNGEWNSFETNKIHFSDRLLTWMFDVGCHKEYKQELHIDYKHPAPSKSFYTRPGISK